MATFPQSPDRRRSAPSGPASSIIVSLSTDQSPFLLTPAFLQPTPTLSHPPPFFLYVHHLRINGLQNPRNGHFFWDGLPRTLYFLVFSLRSSFLLPPSFGPNPPSRCSIKIFLFVTLKKSIADSPGTVFFVPARLSFAHDPVFHPDLHLNEFGIDWGFLLLCLG